jgi:hypothetical protein
MAKNNALHFMLLWSDLQERFSWRAVCALNTNVEAFSRSTKRRALADARRFARLADQAWRRHLEAGARLALPKEAA